MSLKPGSTKRFNIICAPYFLKITSCIHVQDAWIPRLKLSLIICIVSKGEHWEKSHLEVCQSSLVSQASSASRRPLAVSTWRSGQPSRPSTAGGCGYLWCPGGTSWQGCTPGAIRDNMNLMLSILLWCHKLFIYLIGVSWGYSRIFHSTEDVQHCGLRKWGRAWKKPTPSAGGRETFPHVAAEKGSTRWTWTPWSYAVL